MKPISVKQLAFTGVMAAVICVLAPWSLHLPFSPVPISLGTLAAYFVVVVAGCKLGTLSVFLYLLLGLAGLPVFAGFAAGPGVLFGPTGGYLIGYLLLALISGFFVDHWNDRLLPSIAGILLGTAALYLLGTFWLAHQASYTLPQAFFAAVVPFLPGDAVKMAVALTVGRQVRRRLQRISVFSPMQSA